MVKPKLVGITKIRDTYDTIPTRFTRGSGVGPHKGIVRWQ